MSIADFGAGAQIGLKQLLLQRMQAQQYADHLKQQQFENERALHREKSGDEQTSYLRQRQEAMDAEQQMVHDVAQGDKLNESIPGDTRLAPTDRAVGYLRTAGVPLQSVPGVPAMGPEFQGPMEHGVTPQQAQSGIGAGFLKTASAAQQNTATDNARRDEAERRAEAAQAEAARHGRAMEAKGSERAPHRVVQQGIGPDGKPALLSVDLDTGQAQPVQMPGGFQPNRPAKPVTGAERQTLAFYNRMKDAVDTLERSDNGQPSLEDQYAEQSLPAQMQAAHAPNMLQTAMQQQYRQAQRAYTEARLRKESGAAIPESEFQNDARTYFAQPGDSPEVKKQKAAARKKVIEGLKFGSGGAYDEFYGEHGGTGAPAGPPAPAARPSAADLIKKYAR
jgi:hypothetical protein